MTTTRNDEYPAPRRRSSGALGLLGAVPAVIAGVVLLAAPRVSAGAGVGDDDGGRLERDQAQVFDRLVSLRTSMERLAQQLEAQGRDTKAGLLRKAITELVDRDLEGKKTEILDAVGANDLRAVEKIQAFTQDLDAIYRLLLNQGDLDSMEKELDQIRKALNDLGALKDEEKEVRERTERLSGSKVEALEKLTQELEHTLERQQQLREENEARQRSAEQRSDLARQADEIAQALERQSAVVRALRAEERERAGRSRELVERAERALESGTQEERAEAARQIEEELAGSELDRPALESALRELAAELPRAAAADPQRGNEQDPGRGAEQDAARSALEQAKSEVEKALSAEPDAAEKSRRDASAREEAELSAAARTLEEDLEKVAQERSSPSLTDSAQSLAKARERMSSAEQELGEQDLAAASESAQAAEKALEEAYEGVRREMAEAERKNQEAQARQDFLKGRTAELREEARRATQSKDTSAAPNDSSPGEQLDQALARAENQMKQAAQELGAGQDANAQQSQSGAEQSLEESLAKAKQALEDARREESSSSAQAASRERERQELAEKQQDVRERTRQLMQRLQDLQRPRGGEQLSSAERAMSRAEQSLKEEDLSGAEEAEREAEKHLQDAERQLKQEEERYEDLRQEELLYRIQEKLVELRDRSEALLGRLVDVDRERAGEARVPRRLLREIASVRDEANAIAALNTEAIEKLAESSSPVFPWLLEKNGDDLGRVAQELEGRAPETGEFPQFLLNDVVERYQRLLSALEEERKNREEQAKKEQEKKDQNQEDPQQPQQGQNPLIPPIAELVMLRQLQESMLEDMRGLRLRAIDAPSGPEEQKSAAEVRGRLLERLGHRQEELLQLFDSLLRTQGLDPETLGGDQP